MTFERFNDAGRAEHQYVGVAALDEDLAGDRIGREQVTVGDRQPDFRKRGPCFAAG